MLESLTITVSCMCFVNLKKTFGLSCIFWAILDFLDGI